MTKANLVITILALVIAIFLLVAFIDNHNMNQQHELLAEKSKAIELERKALLEKSVTVQPVSKMDDDPSTNKMRVKAPENVGISNAVTSVRRIKNLAENYLGRNGHWPESNADLEWNPERTTHRLIQSIRIDHGDIFVFLKPEVGNDKIIRIYPTLDNNPYDWKCSTNLELKGPTYFGGMTCEQVSSLSFTGSYF